MAKKTAMISYTTIITLFLLVFTESSHKIIANYIADIYILLIAAGVAFFLFIVLHNKKLKKKRYYEIIRLTMILFIALSVESFANFMLAEIGEWLSLMITIIVIYSMAWYGYIETHKLKAL